MAGEDEFEVDYSVTNTEEYPASFTDCHAHDSSMYCVDEDGEDVAVNAEGGGGHDSDDEESHSDHESEGENCHFHAGVE